MSGPVARWLETFMCKQYADQFEQFGFKTLRSVCQLQPSHLRAMQIAPEHSDKILENVSVLRQTMHAGIESESADSTHLYSDETGSMNQYNTGNMYPGNSHVMGNGYGQHPSIMGSHIHSMHQQYMNSYQGQIQGHMMSHSPAQAYPQYPQPIMSTHQGYGSSFSPGYHDASPSYPPTSSSVPVHHHMRSSFVPQNPQDVADSIFHMTANYGPSRSAKYPLEPLPPSMPAQLMSNSGQMTGPQRYPYPNSSPMYQNNSASPMSIRSPASMHSNHSAQSHGSSPAQGPSPHGMYPATTTQSTGMRSPGHQPMRSPVHATNYPHLMMSHTSQAPVMNQQPSPVLSQTRMASPTQPGHFSPAPQQQQRQHQHHQQSVAPTVYTNMASQNAVLQPVSHAQTAPPGGGSGDSGQKRDDGMPQSSGHNPLQSLQKLVLLPESRVVDPKSVVHDSDELGITEDLVPTDVVAKSADEWVQQDVVLDSKTSQNQGNTDQLIGTDVQSTPEVGGSGTADTVNNKSTNLPQDNESSRESNHSPVAHMAANGEQTVKQDSIEGISRLETPMCPPKKRGRKSNSDRLTGNEIKTSSEFFPEKGRASGDKKVLASQDDLSKGGADCATDSSKDDGKKSKSSGEFSRIKRTKCCVSSELRPSDDLIAKKRAAEREYEYHGSDDESPEKSSPPRVSHSINNILRHSRVLDSITPPSASQSIEIPSGSGKQEVSSDSKATVNSSKKSRQRRNSGDVILKKRKSVIHSASHSSVVVSKDNENGKVDHLLTGSECGSAKKDEVLNETKLLFDTSSEDTAVKKAKTDTSMDSSRGDGVGFNSYALSAGGAVSTSTPATNEAPKRKRGRPVGSKNKVKSMTPQGVMVKEDGGMKKKRGRKPKSEILKSEEQNVLIPQKMADSVALNKRKNEEKFKGPYIHVKGSNDNPDSCIVVNDPDELCEKLNDKQDKHSKCRTSYLTDATRLAMQKSAAVPSSKPSSSKWLCALCGKETSHSGLGDLFGPYFLSAIKSCSPLSPPLARHVQKESSENVPKKRGRKKRKADDSVTVPESESKHVRRPSVKRSMSADGFLPENEVWLHEDCLVWCQGVYLIGNKLYGLEEALADARPSVCSSCRSPGAFIGCLTKGCGMKYHYLCGMQKGCLMDEDNFTLLCPKHKEKKMRAFAKT